MTLLVEKLETLDKNNVLSIRKEILALKTKLKECEDSKSELAPLGPPPPAPGKHTIFLPLEIYPIVSCEKGGEEILDCSGGGRVGFLPSEFYSSMF